MATVARGAADQAREAARLRYELARLRDRRTVRAALALSAWRRGGRSAALAALRGRLPREDVPGPSHVPLRPPYPQLRVVHTGARPLLAGAVVGERTDRMTAVPVITRDRPDLLLVEVGHDLDAPTLAAAVAATRGAGGRVVTVGDAMAGAVPDADLHVRLASDAEVVGDGPGGRAAEQAVAASGVEVVELPAAIDLRAWSPAGLDDASEVQVHRTASGLTATDVRRQPIVVVDDPAVPGPARCLELLATGALVVTRRHPGLAPALAGLDRASRDALLAPAGVPLEPLVTALLADDDHRRRLSVRVRRHLHRTCSTRVAVAAIVAALGWGDPPSERISVLLATRRPEQLEQVLGELAAQRGVEHEVILLPHGDAPIPDRLPGADRIATVQRVGADRPLGAVLDHGLDWASGEYVAKVDDDDRYGPDHLADLLLALHHSGADIVGRRVHGVFHTGSAVTVHPPPGGEERFEDHLPGATLLLPVDRMRAVRWRHVPRAVDTELIRAIHLDGGSAYTTHRYGFVRVRHDDHTSEETPVSAARVVPGLDRRLLEA